MFRARGIPITRGDRRGPLGAEILVAEPWSGWNKDGETVRTGIRPRPTDTPAGREAGPTAPVSARSDSTRTCELRDRDGRFTDRGHADGRTSWRWCDAQRTRTAVPHSACCGVFAHIRGRFGRRSRHIAPATSVRGGVNVRAATSSRRASPPVIPANTPATSGSRHDGTPTAAVAAIRTGRCLYSYPGSGARAWSAWCTDA